MSQVFDAKRFSLLFKKMLLERPVQTLGVIGLLLILSVILYAGARQLAGFGAAQNLTFVWGLAGGGFFLASFVFGYFTSNASGSSYLALPASFFEKWLCGILLVGIVYPIIFLAIFHLLDVIFVAAYHNGLDPNTPYYKQAYESVFTFNINGIIARKVYVIFFLLTGSMLTGGLYFNKAALIKTGIAVCIVFLSLLGLNWLVAISFFGHIEDAWLYDHVTLSVGKATGTLLLPSDIENLFHYLFGLMLPAVLWLLPLIRLKEKEF